MLFLERDEVAELLPMAACMDAVERAFVAHANGELPAKPGVLGTHLANGGFHVKTAAIGMAPGYYAAKINANFPENTARHGLPTIQGLIALFDSETGRLLAVMDSVEITILRTAAASAIAARHLARHDAATLLICGCGNQGRAHVRFLSLVRPLRRVLAFDKDSTRAAAFADAMHAETGLEVEPVGTISEAFPACDMAVTCTPARKAIVADVDVRPGQFIAAIGADSEGKQELEPAILSRARVVADIAEQSAQLGEMQHAIASKRLTLADLHAELGQILAGHRPGRTSDDEIFVFDSTGTALQDVAAAALVYQLAGARK